MQILAPLAGLLGIQLETLTDNVKRTLIVGVLIGLFVAIALGFALAAGYIALADKFSPLTAALTISGGALILAMAVYLGSLIGQGSRKRQEAERRRSSESSALITSAAISALPLLLRSSLARKIGFPLAAVAAMFILGDRNDDDD
ncbi:hypothetical protein PSQ90_11950 [Devosia rhodophyticola]|uniref:Phage holin family protein n=1 Tax=Devosia rhodophyticola TaxID=3026423 RepID=A0ABY7YUH4_9HYPH|nr:hypothetical protein [Devosia rhodophyticola]WDR05003.1 hypothetical protein PSQ90_11950 [Devosia rhodophyticola]